MSKVSTCRVVAISDKPEDHAVSVHVVSGRRDVHHLDGAAREAEGQRPQRALPAPVGQVVESGERPLHLVRLEVDLERGPSELLLRHKASLRLDWPFFGLRCCMIRIALLMSDQCIELVHAWLVRRSPGQKRDAVGRGPAAEGEERAPAEGAPEEGHCDVLLQLKQLGD